MSRAEMFLAWCEDFFGEVADFFSHYFMGGYNLWSNPWAAFLLIVALAGAILIYDLSDLEGDESRANSIRSAASSALILAPLIAIMFWLPFTVLVGYFFGPVRP